MWKYAVVFVDVELTAGKPPTGVLMNADLCALLAAAKTDNRLVILDF